MIVDRRIAYIKEPRSLQPCKNIRDMHGFPIIAIAQKKKRDKKRNKKSTFNYAFHASASNTVDKRYMHAKPMATAKAVLASVDWTRLEIKEM